MWMIVIIIAIALGQCYIFFCKTLPGIKRYKSIFNNTDNLQLKKKEVRTGTRIVEKPVTEYQYDAVSHSFVSKDSGQVETVEEEYEYEVGTKAPQIHGGNESDVFKRIIDSINRYLRENESRTSDFALLKDIVDRNTDAVEEDTRELIPLPLYLGLAGTMLGIALGVGSLVFGHGLEAMFNAENTGVSAQGIAPLLRDVSLAMICSFIGLLFTTWGTFSMRKTKTAVESDKHGFLSWMQAKLLPEMPDNASSVMQKLTGDLKSFNRDFERNGQHLNQALQAINQATKDNARLLEAVNELKQVRVAGSNLALYERLTAATSEIGTLASYLNNCNSYLEQVRALNEKLDKSEQRMRALEEMGEYFHKEKSQIEHVSNTTLNAVGHTDEAIRKSTEQFAENIASYFTKMQEALVKQSEKLDKALDEQQQVIVKKTGELSQLVNELKNLQDVKRTMKEMLDAYREQNKLLSAAISQRGNNTTPLLIQQPKAKLPVWLVAIVIAVAVLILMAVLLYFAHTFHLFNL